MILTYCLEPLQMSPFFPCRQIPTPECLPKHGDSSSMLIICFEFAPDLAAELRRRFPAARLFAVGDNPAQVPGDCQLIPTENCGVSMAAVVRALQDTEQQAVKIRRQTAAMATRVCAFIQVQLTILQADEAVRLGLRLELLRALQASNGQAHAELTGQFLRSNSKLPLFCDEAADLLDNIIKAFPAPLTPTEKNDVETVLDLTEWLESGGDLISWIRKRKNENTEKFVELCRRARIFIPLTGCRKLICGTRLDSDLRSKNGVLLIARGTMISENHIRAINRLQKNKELERSPQ